MNESQKRQLYNITHDDRIALDDNWNTALDRYNKLYNNNDYLSLSGSVDRLTKNTYTDEQRNKIMNRVIDCSLYLCGDPYYNQLTLVNLLADMYDFNPILAVRIDMYLSAFKNSIKCRKCESANVHRSITLKNTTICDNCNYHMYTP